MKKTDDSKHVEVIRAYSKHFEEALRDLQKTKAQYAKLVELDLPALQYVPSDFEDWDFDVEYEDE